MFHLCVCVCVYYSVSSYHLVVVLQCVLLSPGSGTMCVLVSPGSGTTLCPAVTW